MVSAPSFFEPLDGPGTYRCGAWAVHIWVPWAGQLPQCAGYRSMVAYDQFRGGHIRPSSCYSSDFRCAGYASSNGDLETLQPGGRRVEPMLWHASMIRSGASRSMGLESCIGR